MASRGEKLPNLKICLDNTEDDDDLDDELSVGDNISNEDDVIVQPEIVEDNEREDCVEFNVNLSGVHPHQLEEDDHAKKKIQFKPELTKKYENKAGNFCTGIDITSKEAFEKKKERAQRFGLPVDEVEEKIKLSALYTSLGIKEGDLHKDERGIRLEAIHLRGTENMSTQDVFKYFIEFAPGAVEWIDDKSCNVVWLDTVTAARAMIKLSTSDEQADILLEDFRKSRKEKTSLIKKDEPKLEDVEMEEVTTQKSEVSKDAEKKDDESRTVIDEQQMEVEEEDDVLDLCADEELKQKQTTGKAATSHEQQAKPQKQQPQKSKSLDEECDSGVEDNTSDKDDESDDKDDHSDQDSSSDKKNDEVSKVGEMTDDKTSTGDELSRAISWPPGRWRLGKECPKARYLFMRFATKADKKIPGAEKKSKYYQKHGNPNYGGMKGLISGTRKRKYVYEKLKSEAVETKDIIVNVKKNDDVEDEGEEGEIFDSGDNQDVSSAQKISVLKRDLDIHATVDKDDDEDELDMDAELEQLLGTPTKKRTMRMYADDEEEQLRAKRTARAGIFTVTRDVEESKPGKIRDARDLIRQAHSRPKFVSDSNPQLRSDDLRARILNKRKNRIHYHSNSDDDDDDDDRTDKAKISRSDLRSKLRDTRTANSSSYSSSQHIIRSNREVGRSYKRDKDEEGGGRILLKYESNSDDDMGNTDLKSRLGPVKKTAPPDSDDELHSELQTRKLRGKSSDSSEESDMESDSSSDANIRNRDLRSRLGGRRKPNSDYPSMKIEVLD